LGQYHVQSHEEKNSKVGNCINKDIECDNKDNTNKGCVHISLQHRNAHGRVDFRGGTKTCVSIWNI
jgi:hypothetical protein